MPPSSAAHAHARPRILVAADDVGYRQLLARAIAKMGYEAATADATPQAVASHRGGSLGAVIATVMMPSLQGAALLQELARWPCRTPVVAVGEPGTGDQVLGALAGRPAAFLPNPFPRSSLQDVLRDLLRAPPQDSGPVAAPPAFDVRAAALAIKTGNAQVPAIAPIASEIQRLLGDPECGVDGVVSVVGQDAAVTAGILKLANSSRYRPPSPIRNLRTACLRLGNTRVLALAQEAVLRDLFAVGSGPVQQIAADLWRHTRVKAGAARALAAAARVTRPDEVQVAAMMVDVGEVALLRVCAALQPRSAPWRDEGFLRAVAAGIGAEHEDVSGFLLLRWGLDRPLVALARHHHGRRRRAPGPAPRGSAPIRAVVEAAWAGACEAGFGWLPGHEDADPSSALATLRLSRDDLDAALAAAAAWADDG